MLLNHFSKKNFLGFASVVNLVLFVVLITFHPIQNTDIWFHLKAGEEILSKESIPRAEYFSHTASGKEWTDQSWLFEVVTYFILSHFGFISLFLLKVLVFVAFLGIYILIAREFKIKSGLYTLIIIFTVLPLGTLFWVLRPHIFSYLFFALTMLALFKIRYFTKNAFSAWWLPIVFWLWGNIHASIIAGLGILGVFLFEEFFLFLGPLLKERKTLKALVKSYRLSKLWQNYLRPVTILILLCVGLSFLNPNTYHQHLYVFKIKPSYIAESIKEWLPTLSFTFSPYIYIFFGLLVAFSLLIIGQWVFSFKLKKTVSLFEFTTVLTFSFLSFTAVRHVGNYLVVVLPFVFLSIFRLSKNIHFKYPRFKRAFEILPPVVTLFVLLFLFRIERPSLRTYSFDLHPYTSVEFLRNTFSGGNLFNTYESGGFLIWKLSPRFKVFIDGRWDPYVYGVYEDYLSILEGKNWKELLDEYAVDYVVLKMDDERIVSLWKGLEKDNDWAFIFWDDLGGVFIRRREGKTQEIIEKYGYFKVKIFNPMEESLTEETSSEIIEEYKRATFSSPYNATAYNYLAAVYVELGGFDLAERNLKRSLATNSKYPAAHYNYGILAEKRGDYKQALEYYKKSINTNRVFIPPYKRLGIIYKEKMNDQENAALMFKKILKLSKDESDKEWAESQLKEINW